MYPKDDPPSVRRIESDRDDAYVLEIVGHLSAAEVENLYGLLAAAYETHDKIDLLIILRAYAGFDWRAVFRQDTILGKRNALKHIRKYAVVGGPGWISSMVRLLRPFLRMDMRAFATEEEDAAWRFLGAKPAQQAS